MKGLRGDITLFLVNLICLFQSAVATISLEREEIILDQPPSNSGRSAHFNNDLRAADAADAGHGFDDENKVVMMDLHPASSYIRWIQQRLDSIDAQINIDVGDSSTNGGIHGNNEKKWGSLRRLEGERRQRQHTQMQEELLIERQLIQQKFDDAIAALRGTSSAYAPLMEFSSIIDGNSDDNGDRRRHLKQSSEKLKHHNNAIQEYNDYYRRFSKYEWAVREGRDDDVDWGDRKMQMDDITNALVGTNWEAVEIAFKDEFGNTTQLSPIPTNNSITLSFESKRISGSTGCNRYHSSVDFYAENAFNTSFVATTRMLCGGEGVMEQETNYIKFLSGSEFFYDFVSATAGNGEAQNELILLDSITRPKGHSVPGEIVARFTPLSDSSEERISGDQRANRKLQQNGSRGENRELQTSQKKKGGMFNSYQTSPLHQGYGTHYATIWVGTPSQRQSVIIDTGSQFAAFPCKNCQNCGEEHHTDKYFDPDASTTFRALTCNECQTGECSKKQDQCVFSQTYTEGSSWHAYESMDKVFVGGKELSSSLNPINNAFKTNFPFGCQMKETGLFVTQLADGISEFHLYS